MAYRSFLEEALETARFEHQDPTYMSDGDRVIVLAKIVATGRESGAPVGGPIAYVYEMRDGLISRQEVHPDGEALLHSLGIEE